jgi:hypothetical protein
MKNTFKILIFLSFPLFSQQLPLTIWGQLQNDFIILQDTGKELKNIFDYAGINMLTINAKTKESKYGKIDASADLILFYGKYANFILFYSTNPMVSIFDKASVLMFDLRKLYGELSFKYMDISIGRQIINLGQGFVFSPIDIFTSIEHLDLNYRRRGSDVIRIKIPINDLSGIDIISKLNSKQNGIEASLKAFTNVKGFDISAIGIYRGDLKEIITGLTFKGDLFIGLYGELVEHWMENNKRNTQIMLGADYSIFKLLYFMAEYLFNEKPQAADSTSILYFSKTGQLCFSKHYGFFLIRYIINEIMNISANTIIDIPSKSSILTFTYFYNVFQNTDLSFYVRYFYGDFSGILCNKTANMQYGLRTDIRF